MDHYIIQLTQEALWLMLILSAPFLITSTLIGLLVSFLQAITQIQEQTLVFSVKIAVFAVVITAFSGLIGETLASFSSRVFAGIPTATPP